jgi:hypothetical protein
LYVLGVVLLSRHCGKNVYEAKAGAANEYKVQSLPLSGPHDVFDILTHHPARFQVVAVVITKNKY